MVPREAAEVPVGPIRPVGSVRPTRTPAPAGRLARLRGALSVREWGSLGGMAGTVAALHLSGWGILLWLVVPNHYRLGNSGTFGVFTGVTAYTLGMRHAFDADHISAIDNTTRKLMADGRRPLSVGFWFSLGHSSIVFGLSLLLGLGLRSLSGGVADEHSRLHLFTGLIGTLISAVFLYLIAAINLVVLRGIVGVFRQMRRGEFDEARLEEQLAARGLMSRVFGRLMGSIRSPWQMCLVGMLFGLGFDTATEIALLALAGTSAAVGLPWYAILCLPLLFAAGMSLLDTIDGTFMNFAYGWAFSKPVRKVYYNITITGLSVAVALIVGTVELLSLLASRLSLTGGLWGWISGLDLNLVGFAIVGLFVGVWLVAVLVWRYGRIEERWSRGALAAQEPAE